MKVLSLLTGGPDIERLATKIEMAGYQIISVENQAQANGKLSGETYQVVIVDCSMVGDNFIKNVRALHTNEYVYIFGLTADDAASVRDHSINNADEYLQKPVEPDELIARLSVVDRYINILSTIRSRHETKEPLRDMITGTFSRTTIKELLSAEVNRYNRNKRSFLVALVKMNDAANIQDKYGEDIFQEILSQVALKIWACVRAYDLIGRWNEQSFMIMLPETTRTGASIVADRILKKINSVPVILNNGEKIELSASIGIVKSGPDELVSVNSLIESVERALTSAIDAGRNQVVIT